MNEKRSIKEALDKIKNGVSDAARENPEPTYAPKKTVSQILSETASMAESTRKIVTGLSIEMDVHLALHWLVGTYNDTPPKVMGSPELFSILCKARAARLEKVEEVSPAELWDWVEADVLEILNANKSLWED